MANVDSRYRLMSLETLNALKSNALEIIKQTQAVGQSHALNGRSQSAVNYNDAMNTLADIEAAIAFKASQVDSGNAGFVSRYTNFGGCR